MGPMNLVKRGNTNMATGALKAKATPAAWGGVGSARGSRPLLGRTRNRIDSANRIRRLFSAYLEAKERHNLRTSRSKMYCVSEGKVSHS